MFEFIRIRKAKNGYIFKKRKEKSAEDATDLNNEDDYEFELVQAEELNQKFGEACNPVSITEEEGEVVVCVQFCRAKVFDRKQRNAPDGIMKARQMYAMFQHEQFGKKDIVILELTDKDKPGMICFDDDAERVYTQTNVPIMQKEGVRYIWLDATQDNRRLLGSCNPHVVKTSSEDIQKWYTGTKMQKS